MADETDDAAAAVEHLLELAFHAMRLAHKNGPALERAGLFTDDPVTRAFLKQTQVVWLSMSGLQQTEILAGRRPW